MSELKSQVIKKLSEKDHILQRSGMYLGSSTLTKSKEYIIDDTNEPLFKETEIEYVPGLVKIFNELIDNSIDEYVRTKGKFSTTILVEVNEVSFMVKDNGRGIPVTEVEDEHGNKLYQPELAWCHARAGSNFEDDNSSTIGTNGVGSMIASVFSSEFEGISQDGEQKCVVRCLDNNSSIETKIYKSKQKGVQVTITPDLKRFGIDIIDEHHKKMIEQRLYNLSVSYPGITFKLNGNRIKLNAKKFLKMFGSEGSIIEEEKFSIGVFHSDTDDFKHFTLMNGLTLKAGGTHMDYISNGITRILRDKIVKKYKSIKPADVKRKLFVVCIMKDFKGPKYETQTKEKLTNPVKDISEYFKEFDLEKFANKVYANKTVTDSIIDYFRIAEEFKKKQELKGLDKKKKKIKSEKYTRAVGDNKILILAEGQSAKDGLMPILGRDGIAYYELKGKPLNAYNSSQQKFVANKELSELYQIVKNENFDLVLTGTDQDLDGISIASLIIGFYKRYLPEELAEGKLGRLETPVFFTRGKDKKPKDWYYSLRDVPSEAGEYMKGLGSWEPEDLEYIIEQDGIEKMISIFNDNSSESIEEWLGESSAPRKKYILDNDFDLIKL